MKTAIPWVLIVVLLGGVYFLYAANKEKEVALAKQTQDLEELDKLRQENEELKKQIPQAGELARLRKDNEDLIRMRGENQRLRDDAKRLTTQLSSSQSQIAQAQQAQQQLSVQLANESQALRDHTQKVQETQASAEQIKFQTDTCINNLRMIDGAKQTWALELKKTAIDTPTAADIAPYLGNNGAQIVCPGGGTYSINAVNQPPTCNVPNHVLK